MHDIAKMPFGPQHPYSKEPVFFELEVEGSEVVGAEPHLGYIHRGVETIFEGKTVDAVMHAAERICGICPQSHCGAFTRAVEDATDIETTMNVKLQRTMIAELERIHSHVLWAGLMMHEIGLDSMFMYMWREREKILEIFDEITGSRIHHSPNMTGTVKRALTEKDLEFVRKKVDEVNGYIMKNKTTIQRNDVIRERLRGKGIVTKNKAVQWGLVGPVARAAGVEFDLRKNDPYEAYADIDFEMITGNAGCAMDRLAVRLHEINESAKIIQQCCDKYDVMKGVPKKVICNPTDTYTYGRVEAPRGENFHFSHIKNGIISYHKVRTPTLANISTYGPLLVGNDITDVPVIIASMDPCFACMDRVLVVKDGKREELTGHQFMHKYCDHDDSHQPMHKVCDKHD